MNSIHHDSCYAAIVAEGEMLKCCEEKRYDSRDIWIPRTGMMCVHGCLHVPACMCPCMCTTQAETCRSTHAHINEGSELVPLTCIDKLTCLGTK